MKRRKPNDIFKTNVSVPVPATDVKTEEAKEPELTFVEENRAEDIAIDKCVTWMHDHPKYTKEELKEVKAGFIKEARKEVLAARAKHDN